jgi:hypothetical protein
VQTASGNKTKQITKNQSIGESGAVGVSVWICAGREHARLD